MNIKTNIRSVEIKKRQTGEYEEVRIIFGPHYFIDLRTQENGKIEFSLGATHHGFRVDASEVNGELEKIIELVRKLQPKLAFD